MASFDVLVLPGDGIGPEVTAEGVRALRAVAERFGHTFTFEHDDVGGCAIDAHGVALRDSTLARAKRADAVLFGAVGGPKWDDPSARVRPEQGLLALRAGLELWANLRPVKPHTALLSSSTLKREVLEGVDILVIRELTSGIYFGKPSERRTRSDGLREALDTMYYREDEVRRVAQMGFELARSRRGKLASVDKANVLSASRLWREVVIEVARDFSDVAYESVLVDAMTMHLIRRPADFDVVIAGNMFGDIITDEASMLTGSLGLLPSASLGTPRSDGSSLGLYEPIHGSAPDIAGRGIANPLGMILCAAMLLRHSCRLEKEAAALETAVAAAVDAGVRTPDLGGTTTPVSTSAMADAVLAQLGA